MYACVYRANSEFEWLLTVAPVTESNLPVLIAVWGDLAVGRHRVLVKGRMSDRGSDGRGMRMIKLSPSRTTDARDFAAKSRSSALSYQVQCI
jgi:hypothetical protein